MKLLEVEVPCQEDPDLFFSDDESNKTEAKKICSTCPFKDKCLLQAKKLNEDYGIWGGKDFSKVKQLTPGKHNILLGLCRNGRHKYTPPGTCKGCVKESKARSWKKRYEKKKADGTLVHNASRKKNVIGGKCKNNHELTLNNTRVRSYDKALMCSDCIRRIRPTVISSRIRRGY